MPADSFFAKPGMGAAELVLGVDTCGPTGSVALGLLSGKSVQILGQKELAGRSYSATLVTAIEELLAEGGARLRDVQAIVAVYGPGSFTGVRVGLSAVKGLAEPAQIPVVKVSRLAVLAWKARVQSAALDAHRCEVFLRVAGEKSEVRELLAGAAELKLIQPPDQVAVSDDGAATLMASVWPGAHLLKTEAPTAVDAIQLAIASIEAGEFVDLATLDGHYLRRSDAEIFGASVQPEGGSCNRR
jgi:tRNA threonylcarbamoyladenosine biosynthesis protein TsaB